MHLEIHTAVVSINVESVFYMRCQQQKKKNSGTSSPPVSTLFIMLILSVNIVAHKVLDEF